MSQLSLFDDDGPSGVGAYGQTTARRTAPHVAGSATSEAAAKRIEGVSGTIRRMVYEHLADLAKCGEGMTAEELEIATGYGGNTIRPRLVELVESGHVRDSGRTRPTRSGRRAVVWVAAEQEHRRSDTPRLKPGACS